MPINRTLQARLDALLECQPEGDQARAHAALEECVERFGEAVLRSLIPAGSLPLAVLAELARGKSREEVAYLLANCFGGSKLN